MILDFIERKLRSFSKTPLYRDVCKIYISYEKMISDSLIIYFNTLIYNNINAEHKTDDLLLRGNEILNFIIQNNLISINKF